jgi:hypothetical protein
VVGEAGGVVTTGGGGVVTMGVGVVEGVVGTIGVEEVLGVVLMDGELVDGVVVVTLVIVCVVMSKTSQRGREKRIECWVCGAKGTWSGDAGDGGHGD